MSTLLNGTRVGDSYDNDDDDDVGNQDILKAVIPWQMI
jgi:hypothetical protein